MSALGVPEMIVLALLVLLIFGPEQLPDLNRSVRKTLTELIVIQRVLAVITMIALALALGLLLAREVGR